jgi:hypothetical protein
MSGDDQARKEARAEVLAECRLIANEAVERSMREVGFRDSAAEFIRDKIDALACVDGGEV